MKNNLESRQAEMRERMTGQIPVITPRRIAELPKSDDGFVSLHRITCDCERCKPATDRRPPIDELVKMIRDAEPLLERDSPEFNAALVLVTAALRNDIGQDSGKLANALNLDSLEVTQWCARLRQNGIWKDDKWSFSEDVEIGTPGWEVEFWLQTLVALGIITTSPQQTTKPKITRTKPKKPPKTEATAEVLAVQRATTTTTPVKSAKVTWCQDCWINNGRRTAASQTVEGDSLCCSCATEREKLLV